MPIVINSLGGGCTHTRTRIPTFADKAILRNQACTGLWPARTWFKKPQHFIASNSSSLSFVKFHSYLELFLSIFNNPPPKFFPATVIGHITGCSIYKLLTTSFYLQMVSCNYHLGSAICKYQRCNGLRFTSLSTFINENMSEISPGYFLC